jgi:hypothetical protein
MVFTASRPTRTWIIKPDDGSSIIDFTMNVTRPFSDPSTLRHNRVMGTSSDTIWISERARSLGFDLCGVVRAESFPELAQFEEWLGRGYTG